MTQLITLLTDFGTADGYVGDMKGVLVTTAPGCVLIDIAHDIAAHEVDLGRLALARYWRRFPAGVVHLVVVDPGVGSARAAIAVESEGRFLVGPDNGVLSPALLHPHARCVLLPVPVSAAPTFHGRDVFAPVAAQLALGVPLLALGVEHDAPVIRRTPEPVRADDKSIVGVVLAVDRFGNAVTNLIARRGGFVEVAGLRLAVKKTYADVDVGEGVALVGSSGLIEIAVREGRASERLGLARGERVVLWTA